MDSTTYPVVEKFVSVNGEGQRAGELAAFIRFAGCNLNCSYCDTTWANEPGVEAQQLSCADVVSFVRASGVGCVTLTGGEPVLQQGLPRLVEALLGQKGPQGEGLWVEIETNGAAELAPLAKLRQTREALPEACGTLSFTVDYKLPSSGFEGAMLAENYALLGTQDTVKFVCGSRGDLERALEVCQQFQLPSRVPVFLSPVFGQLEAAQIVDFMKSHAMHWARAQVQLHKVIWPQVEKGV